MVFYTICPVLVASAIAVEFGWLDEEFARVDATPVYLRSLPGNVGWLPHFRHSMTPLFRDGGAIPTLWARADLADTTLIATTATQGGGQLLVRADAPIERVADLRGRRIGLTRSPSLERIDFARATAEFGIRAALRLGGLDAAEVRFVDLVQDPDPAALAPAARPAQLWSQLKALARAHGEADVAALREGRVDVIYSSLGRTRRLVDSGQCRVLVDLAAQPDWTLQLANGPYTTAVDSAFARDRPEVVIAFLRAAIRAGRWINDHRAEAAALFPRLTHLPDPRVALEAIGRHDFVPALPQRNLAGLTLLKEFLLERGYIRHDVDPARWADDSFLRAALESLDGPDQAP